MRTKIARRISLTAATLVGAASLLLAPAAATAAQPTVTAAGPVSTIVKAYTDDWAEVYVGSATVTQGESLQVTVSDLREGRELFAVMDTITVPTIRPADHYGDTEFTVDVPADFPVGEHTLVITTTEFEPINVTITVTPGEYTPTPTPEPAPTADPSVPTSMDPTGAPIADAPPVTGGPVPLPALLTGAGAFVGIIIATAIVRRVRGANE